MESFSFGANISVYVGDFWWNCPYMLTTSIRVRLFSNSCIAIEPVHVVLFVK